MPNRIIKEGICVSDTVDRLSWFEEVFFYRLIVNCDDFGRFDARPSVLKSRLFPLKETVTAKTVQSALDKLATVGIVKLYSYDSRPYLQLLTWARHQTIRNKMSKYPGCDDLQAIEINCKQLNANVPVIQSESESESESNPKYSAASESAATQDSAIVETFLLANGEEYEVRQSDVDVFHSCYPGVDILSELRKIKAWCFANPKKRKTRSGAMRLLNGWLSREQNSAPKENNGNSNRQSGTYKSNPQKGYYNFKQGEDPLDGIL